LSESKAHQNDGLRLRLIRRKIGRTQRAFAVELGISTGTLANYEMAKTEMPPNFFRKVYDFYGLNPVPLDPEADPRNLLQMEALARPNAESLTFAFRLMKLRKNASKSWEQAFSPARKLATKTIHLGFLVVSAFWVMEWINRHVPWEVQGLLSLSDADFVGLTILYIVLFIFVLISTPWGIKVSNAAPAG